MSERSEGYSDGYAAGLRWGKRDGDRIAGEAARELHRNQAEVERLVGVERRLSELLCDLTGGRLSKTGYDVRTMVGEVEDVFERYAEEDRAELQAERDRLAATVDRVEALHAPRTVQVITGDCSTEECGHEDECPTVPFRQCVECDRIADEIDTYYSERGVAPTEWPCPTIAAIEGADS